jgi:hypothetical protein
VGAAGARWLSVVSVAVLVAWLFVVRFAGHRFEEKSARGEGASLREAASTDLSETDLSEDAVPASA